MSAAATFFYLASFACFVPVLVHAFHLGIGTGLMVVCIPLFGPVYAFENFEHRWKVPLICGWLGGFLLGFGAQAWMALGG